MAVAPLVERTPHPTGHALTAASTVSRLEWSAAERSLRLARCSGRDVAGGGIRRGCHRLLWTHALATAVNQSACQNKTQRQLSPHSAASFHPDCRAIDLGSLELARGALTFAQQRGQFVPFSLAQLDPITYIHPGLLVGEPDESTNESEIRRRSPPRRTTLHRKARPVPSLHLRILANVPLLSGRNRHAAPLPGQPAGKPFDFRRCRSAVRDVRPSPRFGDKLP